MDARQWTTWHGLGVESMLRHVLCRDIGLLPLVTRDGRKNLGYIQQRLLNFIL
jgi:hypothetical protein